MLGRRYATFHAGAVSLSQGGILLPGPKRCGKSTLTLGLLLKGARYVSDDVAILDHRSLRLTPFGDGVSLRREAITLFRGGRAMDRDSSGREWRPAPAGRIYVT